MALFRRAKPPPEDSPGNEEQPGAAKKKGGWKRPANTAFKQQRLKAWQPILTPKTVLPTLFILGIIFAPIGGLLVWGSSQVSMIKLDYTDCASATSGFSTLPKYQYNLRSADAKLSFVPPQWSYSSQPNSTCRIRFELPAELKPPIFLYYQLTNFYQNHRRYVQSLDTDQLKGKAVDSNTLKNGNCKPLDVVGDKPIYPCGLIANSLFNDTISNPVWLNPQGSTNSNSTYTFSYEGIAWPGEAKKYAAVPGYGNLSAIVPPPNWAARFPQGYTESNPPPNLRTDEHFQNWMRTAGLPTFSKLYGRNDKDAMGKGNYEITINMNYPVTGFGGTKSVVISTVSWIGGKNPFLGWAYVGAASLFVLLAVAGTARHLIKPRKLGDMSLLSWNQPASVGPTTR